MKKSSIILDSEEIQSSGTEELPELLRGAPGLQIPQGFVAQLNMKLDAFLERRGIPVYGFTEINHAEFVKGKAIRAARESRRQLEQEREVEE